MIKFVGSLAFICLGLFQLNMTQKLIYDDKINLSLYIEMSGIGLLLSIFSVWLVSKYDRRNNQSKFSWGSISIIAIAILLLTLYNVNRQVIYLIMMMTYLGFYWLIMGIVILFEMKYVKINKI